MGNELHPAYRIPALFRAPFKADFCAFLVFLALLSARKLSSDDYPRRTASRRSRNAAIARRPFAAVTSSADVLPFAQF